METIFYWIIHFFTGCPKYDEIKTGTIIKKGRLINIYQCTECGRHRKEVFWRDLTPSEIAQEF